MAPSSRSAAADEALPPLSPQDVRRRAYLETVFRAHYTSLYNVARSRGSQNPHDAQDAIQTVFNRLLKERVNFVDAVLAAADPTAPAEQLLAHIYSSVRWRMSNEYRQDVQQERHLAAAADSLRPAPMSRPDEDFEALELAGHLRQAFRLLSPQEWRVFRCLQLRHMTQVATAELLGVSPSTVQMLHARAMRKLARALGPHLPDGWTLTAPRRHATRRPVTPPHSTRADEPGVSL